MRQQSVQLGQIEVGQIEGNSYQVVEGVSGKQIAVTGPLQLSDGTTIVPES